jgi:hypothetical protein
MMAMKHLFLIACALTCGNALAGSISSTVTSQTPAIELVSQSVSLETGMKPEFFRESGKYVTLSGALQAKIKSKTSLSISQPVIWTEDPEEPVQLLDLDIGMGHPIASTKLLNDQLSLGSSVSLRGSAPFSKISRDDTLRGTAGAGLRFTAGVAKLSISLSPSYRHYFYRLTFNALGQPNPFSALSLGTSLDYQILEPLSVSYSYATSLRTYHEGFASRYTYSSSLSLGYDLLPYSLYAGLSSSDQQIKNLKRKTPKIYDKELTYAFLGMGCQI